MVVNYVIEEGNDVSQRMLNLLDRISWTENFTKLFLTQWSDSAIDDHFQFTAATNHPPSNASTIFIGDNKDQHKAVLHSALSFFEKEEDCKNSDYDIKKKLDSQRMERAVY
ncbi:hypothetical protein T11_7451 [Trichinella zimbabwensis]|uniref:Uncharacterized protein n=1 Tax=Trichinella zimbabwensis TaxID=268475 RepID=A0A0V1HCJ5_9BILA|nr:hypothetical protein T11_7451 [Trichinella zimbabwensis]